MHWKKWKRFRKNIRRKTQHKITTQSLLEKCFCLSQWSWPKNGSKHFNYNFERQWTESKFLYNQAIFYSRLKMKMKTKFGLNGKMIKSYLNKLSKMLSGIKKDVVNCKIPWKRTSVNPCILKCKSQRIKPLNNRRHKQKEILSMRLSLKLALKWRKRQKFFTKMRKLEL